MARVYTILDAPIKPVLHERGLPAPAPSDRVELWEPRWDTPGEADGPAHGGGIKGDAGPFPPNWSRFLDGSVTARRGGPDGSQKRPSTAAFLASPANLTLAARSRLPPPPPPPPPPRTGNRTSAGSAGSEPPPILVTLEGWDEPSAGPAHDAGGGGGVAAAPTGGLGRLVQRIRTKLLLDGFTPLDALAPFRHYDRAGAGRVPAGCARLALLELGLRLPPALVDALARRAAARSGESGSRCAAPVRVEFSGPCPRGLR